eukprot:gene26674-35349_t
MSSKPRPPNAPGSNGLRGGIKQYSLKTTTGQWLEGYGGPSGYQRGFTTVDFETEAQHAQIGATLRKAPEFGAALPNPNALYTNSPRCADSFSTVGKEKLDWKTSTTIMQESVVGKNKDSYYKPTPTMTREKLEEYRKKWTIDNEVGRQYRFQTETRTAGNAVNKSFQTLSLRFLPGTPKSLEDFRERLIEKYGILGLCVLRFSLGNSDFITFRNLKASISSIGVDIKPYDLNQIVAFVTPSTEEIPTKSFIDALKGSTPSFEQRPVETAFDSRFLTEGPAVPLSTVIDAIRCDAYPEIKEGLKQFLPAYSTDRETITKSQFVILHAEMWASAPQHYQKVFADAW